MINRLLALLLVPVLALAGPPIKDPKLSGSIDISGVTGMSAPWPVSRGGTGVSSLPKFSVHKNGTGQAGVATSTTTKVTWSTEEFDVGNCFDTATGRFTPNVAGKYLFIANVMPLGHGDGVQMRLWLYKNGSPFKRMANIYGAASSANTQVGNPVIADANGSTDYFEIYFYHENGSSLEVFGDSQSTYWQGSLLP